MTSKKHGLNFYIKVGIVCKKVAQRNLKSKIGKKVKISINQFNQNKQNMDVTINYL